MVNIIQRKEEFKKILLKKDCSIGVNVTLVCGVTIGEYALIVSVPAKQIVWVGISGTSYRVPSPKWHEIKYYIFEVANSKDGLFERLEKVKPYENSIIKIIPQIFIKDKK